MKEYTAQSRINASADKVWSILLDTEKYPEWDPFCDRIEGTVEQGQKLKAYTKLSPGRAFAVKVVELDAPKRMKWAGGMPLGLFKGERTFDVATRDDGSVEFTLREVFSGPMLALIGGSIPDMTEAFEKFAQGLKERAETN